MKPYRRRAAEYKRENQYARSADHIIHGFTEQNSAVVKLPLLPASMDDDFSKVKEIAIHFLVSNQILITYGRDLKQKDDKKLWMALFHKSEKLGLKRLIVNTMDDFYKYVG